MFILFVLMVGVVCAQEVLLTPSTAVSQAVAIRHPNCLLVEDEVRHVMFAYPNDCSKYYSCSNGYAYIVSCPTNLHWSELNYRCEYPEVAKCTELLPIPYPGRFPLPSPPPGVPSYYADPYDCNQYYQCQKIRCPTNMLWSDRSQRCELPYLSECAAKYPSQQYPFQQYPSQQYPFIPPMWEAYGNGIH